MKMHHAKNVLKLLKNNVVHKVEFYDMHSIYWSYSAVFADLCNSYITICTNHYHLHIQHGGLYGDARSSPAIQGFPQQNRHQKPLRNFKSKFKTATYSKKKNMSNTLCF
uniref:Uncharacterized protein n=1 Tax=Parascaris equorum TaxID=6256 RepID=A0A914RA94_PAREQ